MSRRRAVLDSRRRASDPGAHAGLQAVGDVGAMRSRLLIVQSSEATGVADSAISMTTPLGLKSSPPAISG